jgi:hypothetical protein
MIERHYGALLDGAGAGIAGRLDALDATREQEPALGDVPGRAAETAVRTRLGYEPVSYLLADSKTYVCRTWDALVERVLAG